MADRHSVLIETIPDATVATALDDLSRSEQQRYVEFGRSLRKRQFLAARVLLRRELARHLSCNPNRVRIKVGSNGKPYCPDTWLAISISHSADTVAVALAAASSVGVDIERPVATRDHPALAVAAFPPCLAQRAISAKSPDEFYRQWTLLEAIAKARGESAFARESQRLLLDFATMVDSEPLVRNASEWLLHHRKLAGGSHLAVCVQTPASGSVLEVCDRRRR